jgi:hypothetical protein
LVVDDEKIDTQTFDLGAAVTLEAAKPAQAFRQGIEAS